MRRLNKRPKPTRATLRRRRIKAVKTPPPVRYLRLLPPEQAIMTLKAFWPQLFDGNSPRLLATGMREQLFADIVNRDLPLSHKQVIKCLKSLTRSAGYLSRMKVGGLPL
uniref:IncF plasmid conjugative transfer fertility inhibition protein FinO n=1 Tax=Klebsiella pneumoniae TaxID=573 RepID=A0A8B0SU63_KLEPN|nr:IncF plasmid conjugative transfer fertility inhibition protein FinO [Klebsiella pneumoniae]